MHPNLKNPFAALEAWFARRTAALAHPRAPMRAYLIVPVLFGLLSVWMGQDSNWDLQNYHWYNPYALLHGRLQADIAPAQFQSYFNPTIDLPYYLLNSVLPGPLVGFIMGALHGLNFVLLAAIALQLLGERRAEPAERGDATRLALLLALVGTCGVGFLSELGNTMGDNLTSLLVLGSLYLLLRGGRQLPASSNPTPGLLLLAGLLMGVGSGLKLTNVTYAVAACLALLAAPPAPSLPSLPSLPLLRRVGMAFAYGCGVLAGVLALNGYWWWMMWQRFANPLFPQFNQVFRSPLAQPLGVLDTGHLPHGVLEALYWPFVIITDFKRVGEIALRPAIMPVLYVAALVFAGVWLAERFGARTVSASAPPRLSPRARFLLVFGLVAYLAWMKLFSIYRYLVALELLAPLMLWLLIERVAAPRHAARIGAWLLATTTFLALPVMTWGHAGWGEAAFSARFPAFERPESTIVFTAHGNPPMGWLAALAPPGVRVITLAGMPASPAWVERIQAAIASRPGPHYVMVASAKNEKEDGLQRKLAVVNALGLSADGASCARLDRLLHRVRFQVQVKFAPEGGHACTLELQPQYRVDLAPRDAAILQSAQDNLAAYGLQADAAACRQYPAAIGAEAFPFRLCPVSRK